MLSSVVDLLRVLGEENAADETKKVKDSVLYADFGVKFKNDRNYLGTAPYYMPGTAKHICYLKLLRFFCTLSVQFVISGVKSNESRLLCRNRTQSYSCRGTKHYVFAVAL